MARIKGRDVVIDLMDAVAKLEATATKHADLLEAMGTHAVTMSVEMTALSGQVSAVARRMDDLTVRMDDLATRMDDMATRMNGMSSQAHATSQRVGQTSQEMGEVSQRITSLETEFQIHAQNALKSAKLARTTEEQLGRFARLLGDYAGQSTTRFDEIEGRLVKLERKTG